MSRPSRDASVAAFGGARRAAAGAGRFGLWTRDGGALLRRAGTRSSRACPDGGAAVRGLDVVLLGGALDGCSASTRRPSPAGERIATRSRRPRPSPASTPARGVDAAFLLEPTPVASITAVAADGDVMPQKSTYFYPKALTGLVSTRTNGERRDARCR